MSLFDVWGVITVYNPNDEAAAEVAGVSDVLSFDGLADLAIDVDCTVDFPHTLAAGDSFTCSYAYSGTDAPKKNTATATVEESSDVEGGSGSVTIEFASTWSEIEPGTDYGTTNYCVYVVDNMGDSSVYDQHDYTQLARLCVNEYDGGKPQLTEGVTLDVVGGTYVLHYGISTSAQVSAVVHADEVPSCGAGHELHNHAKVLVYGGVGYVDARASVAVIARCEAEELMANRD